MESQGVAERVSGWGVGGGWEGEVSDSPYQLYLRLWQESIQSCLAAVCSSATSFISV